MQSPSVTSNGTKVGQDETEVLAGFLETPTNESGCSGGRLSHRRQAYLRDRFVKKNEGSAC
jgi:hypothetical protein